MKIKLNVSCCLCGEDYKSDIEMPDKWALRYDTVYEEGGFCPEHSIIAEWADSQCPGCVGGWMDCPLWSDFAYKDRRNLTLEDLDVIRAGVCPRRINGSLMSNGAFLKHVDLSEKAPTKSGEAFAQAILDYWKSYDNG